MRVTQAVHWGQESLSLLLGNWESSWLSSTATIGFSWKAGVTSSDVGWSSRTFQALWCLYFLGFAVSNPESWLFQRRF